MKNIPKNEKFLKMKSGIVSLTENLKSIEEKLKAITERIKKLNDQKHDSFKN